MDEKGKVLVQDFLSAHGLGVISTIGLSGRPQAAVVKVAADGLDLLFETFATYRKYRNIQADARVAFVIGWDNGKTVQYEGTAHELAGDDLAAAKEVYYARHPEAQKWDAKPELRFFRVTPTWVRYSDLTAKPWEVLEMVCE